MRRSLAVLALAALLAGCATSRGDRLVAAGRIEDAAAAYEKASGGAWWWSSSDGSFEAAVKLGVLLASPESPLYDPAAARHIWEGVAGRGAGTPWGLEAELLLDRLNSDDGERVAELERQLARARAEMARSERTVERPEAGELADDDRARFEAALAESQGRVARLEAEVARLETEIEQLKALDLGTDDSPRR